jgi:hypothetical protein
MAAVPVVYGTADLALRHRAQLKPGGRRSGWLRSQRRCRPAARRRAAPPAGPGPGLAAEEPRRCCRRPDGARLRRGRRRGPGGGAGAPGIQGPARALAHYAPRAARAAPGGGAGAARRPSSCEPQGAVPYPPSHPRAPLAQIAKLLGAKVVAVDLGQQKMDLLRAQGGRPARGRLHGAPAARVLPAWLHRCWCSAHPGLLATPLLLLHLPTPPTPPTSCRLQAPTR